MKTVKRTFFLLVIVAFVFSSCTKDYSPKPRGYFRIDLPQKKYIHYVPENCPFEFDIPTYAEIKYDTNRFAEPCWMYLVFPSINGQLYITYKPVTENLIKYTEEARSMVYKHTVKANAINEKIIHTQNNAHGMLYDIGGNAASSVQFYITDSVKHYVRASLYFYAPPQADSLAPVISFVREDITHFIDSFKWK